MFDVSVFIDEIIVKKGEDFINSNDKHLCISMVYIFDSIESRDEVFEAIRRTQISNIDPRKYLSNGFDIERAQDDIKRYGVVEYMIVDGAEIDKKLDSDKLGRSIVTAMKFKTVSHKKIFLNMFKLAKKYGVMP
ncbi:MAG: hypothetical protein QW215_03205 [Ignisphaera sp.]